MGPARLAPANSLGKGEPMIERVGRMMSVEVGVADEAVLARPRHRDARSGSTGSSGLIDGSRDIGWE